MAWQPVPLNSMQFRKHVSRLPLTDFIPCFPPTASRLGVLDYAFNSPSFCFPDYTEKSFTFPLSQPTSAINSSNNTVKMVKAGQSCLPIPSLPNKPFCFEMGTRCILSASPLPEILISTILHRPPATDIYRYSCRPPRRLQSHWHSHFRTDR